jgi:S1/P1 Nuclease
MRVFKAICVCLALAIVAVAADRPAQAWGPQGHALIGKIADQLLAGTNAGNKVDQILGTYSLEDAAKWPDCVRSVHKEASGDFKFVQDMFTAPCTAFETADEEKRMEDYASRNWDTFPYRAGHGDHEAYHFADIPIEDGKYAASEIGANDHDVVHAINAAIAKLKGEPVPAPFSIKDDKEAILMLAHFVGDLHQPLHVGAIYLDADGNRVDPHSENEADADSTAGGNFIHFGSKELHGEWDAILKSLQTDASVATLVKAAKKVHTTAGPIEGWAARWATESVKDAAKAYDGVTFEGDGAHKWQATFDDRSSYLTDERAMQKQRVAQAGARLAGIFEEIWP